MGIEKSKTMKDNYSERFSGINNPSKNDSVKIKKNQIIINFDNVSKYVKEFNLDLERIDGNNKFSNLFLSCQKGHKFNIQWSSFKVRKSCKYCYYESIRIPFHEIEKYEKYSRKIRLLTRFNFNRNKIQIDPNNLKNMNPSDYHIDHIYSISDGFTNRVNPEIISSYINLQILNKNDNLKKGKNSDISLTELLEKYSKII